MGELEVFAREVEQAAIAGFVESTEQAPGLLLLTGEAGIGKTTLWLEAVEAARPGRTVLLSRPVEQDARTPYVGLADLLHPQLEAIAGLLAPPDNAVLKEAVLHGTGVARSLRQAFRAAVVGLAEKAPVLIAIDDLQWLDGATRRLVEHTLGQLTREPVTLVAAARTTSSDEGSPAWFRRVAGSVRTTWLDLEPLSEQALAELVHDRLDVAMPEAVARRIHRICGGNPLFGLELAREWNSAGRGSELPVPESLAALLAQALGGLPVDTQELLEAVATLGRPTGPRLALMLGRDVDPQIQDAVGRGVLTVDSTGAIRFPHPMHASVVQQSTPWVRRSRLHRQAAELADDPVERAQHRALAAADPDPEVAAAAEAAAAQAAARGAPDTAAELAQHARRLTPPQDRSGLHRRSLAVGAYLDACGRFREAIGEFDDVLTAPDAGPQRAAALLARSALEDDVCRRGFLAHAALKAGLPDSLKARAYNQLAWSEGFLQMALDTGSDYARRALEAAEQAGDLEQQAVALGRLAHLLAVRGQPDPGYLERAVTSGQVVTVDDRPQLMLGLHLMWRGDLEAAKTILEGQYAEAVRLADDSARPYLLVHLADLAVRRGSGNDLSRHVSERRRLAAYQHEYGGVLSNYVEALAAAYAGPAHQARESAEAGLTQATEQGVVPAQLRLRWVLGLANLLDADPRGAWAVLEPALTTMVEKGVGEPGFVPAVPDAVTALAALGDLPRAKQVAAMLDRSAAAGHRWAAPAQAYCKGLVLLAAGAPDAGATELIEARDSFESIGFKFDAARSTLEAGGALRRSGQRGAAHAMVSDAVRRFAAMGASAWAERAESELARAGGRRTGQTLTAGEEQVAALAAAGRTNREIAAQLFVSVATVEANLTRAYRKLGVSSRSQLTRLRTMAAE